MVDAVQGQDTSVRDTISKGGFVQGAQHPRIFGRGHIGRGHINPASTLAGHCHRVLSQHGLSRQAPRTSMWTRAETHQSGTHQGTHRPREKSTEKSCNIEETYLLIIGKWVRWVPASSITAAASIQPFIFAIPNTYICIYCLYDFMTLGVTLKEFSLCMPRE